MSDTQDMIFISTMSLRFIERDVSDGVDADGDDHWRRAKILQQMFSNPSGEERWRDIPLISPLSR